MKSLNTSSMPRALMLLLLWAIPLSFSFQPMSRISTNQAPPLQQANTLGMLQLSVSSDVSNDLIVDATSIVVSHSEGLLAATPAIGSSLIMLTIVGLLYIWEESVEWVRETVPKTLLPVVESILAEIGGLGFIGLIFGTVLGNSNVKEGLEGLSITLFGESEILVENFEFLHSAFFQVGVGFFMAVGAMAAVGVKKLDEIKQVEGLEQDPETEACNITPEKLVRYMPLLPKKDDNNDIEAIYGANNLWQEIFMDKEERAGRTLLLRHQIMRIFPRLPNTFRVEQVIQASFAENLYKLVELSPLTWIYIIPGLALANAIDLSHEVVNSASPNAAESVGFFFSTPTAIIPSAVTVAASMIWGFWNCWKLTQIKYMVHPKLGIDKSTGAATILPPLVESESKMREFDSSPAWVRPIENIWAKPAKNAFDEVFGAAGGAGLKLYQNSIKYQTWLCLTHIVFFGTQVVPRDFDALLSGATVGDPDHLTAELVTYGSFVLISVLQLLLVAPRAFWNYCLVAVLEEKTARKLLTLSGNDDPMQKEQAIPVALNGTAAVEITP
ncbi:expressed unknown protein [Seminavis robusta]|uniref:Uncharacterized protein n=1 Tax=Seminavis robusta TaxID=568900 RepID=A0A9N8D7D8_9STRA|nr:expressed unknown protein [Seminavis robusta]|eukprot:Sro24_g016510.1 n/a (555) ;mRNA; r:124523-126259